PRARRSRERWPPGRTCCCSTSPPTTWTSSRWSGSSRLCWASTRPSWWWRTTAGSWRRSAPRCSRSRRPGRVTSPAAGTSGARSAPPASSPSAGRSARLIFELSDGRIEVGDGRSARVLLDPAELWLERGEHVSLVGANGAGKTTLIETLAGRRELAAGKLSTGHNVKIGYLSQHGEELGAGGPPGERVL